MVKEENARGGFSVDVEQQDAIIVMRAWGLWDVDLAERFGDAMLEAFDSFGGKPWDIVSDQRDFMPQSDQVQAVIGKLMSAAPQKGMRRAANIASRTLDKMQIARIARENKMDNISFFQTEEEGRTWIQQGR